MRVFLEELLIRSVVIKIVTEIIVSFRKRGNYKIRNILLQFFTVSN